jgi:hypothetical protein
VRLTEDLEVDEVLDDSYAPGVKVVSASTPVEQPEYFRNADDYYLPPEADGPDTSKRAV